MRSIGAFQTEYIALWGENNHGRHIEGWYQTEVLKTSHFKGPFGMKDFEGYNWLSLRAPMILCADFLHDDSASVWPRDDDTEGHFKKQLFGPLYPSKLSLQRVKPLKGLGHRDEPFRRERRLWDWLLFQLVFSGQLTNCSLSHFSVGFTRETGRLPLGSDQTWHLWQPWTEVTQYPEVHSFDTVSPGAQGIRKILWILG